MSRQFFVTGTDTDIGKTYTTIGLLKALNRRGYSTLGIKPVATGCFLKNNIAFNHDAIQLQKASSIQLRYEHINPITFESPVSPNIAASVTNTTLTVQSIIEKTQYARTYPADVHLIEGIGGWDVPLNSSETMADFVKQCGLSVILTVGIRLGCLNHALLTYRAIQQANVPFSGWVANCLNHTVLEKNNIIKTLVEWFDAPCLGVIPFSSQPEKILDIDKLF